MSSSLFCPSRSNYELLKALVKNNFLENVSQVCWARHGKSKNKELVLAKTSQKQNLNRQVIMPRVKSLLELFKDGSKIVQRWFKNCSKMVPKLLEFTPSPPLTGLD